MRRWSPGLLSGKSLPPAAADDGGAVEAIAAGHGVMSELQAAAAGVFAGGFRPPGGVTTGQRCQHWIKSLWRCGALTR